MKKNAKVPKTNGSSSNLLIISLQMQRITLKTLLKTSYVIPSSILKIKLLLVLKLQNRKKLEFT